MCDVWFSGRIAGDSEDHVYWDAAHVWLCLFDSSGFGEAWSMGSLHSAKRPMARRENLSALGLVVWL